MIIVGLWKLLRILPLVAWSFSGIFLGVSITVYYQGVESLNKIHLFLIFLSTLLLQGLIAHAYNDLVDWQTGTDQKSPGILSGGSKVLPQKLMNKVQLTSLARGSIITVVVIALYFLLTIGMEVFIFLFIGLWSAIAYSCSPLQLAYRPWWGEWGCAWPAMVACTTGTSYVLSGGVWYLESILLGMLHATLSITWLMLHHIPDIEADLMANPPKWTTIAYFKVKRGWNGVSLLIECYLFAALILGIFLGYFLDSLILTLIPVSLVLVVFLLLQRTSFAKVEAVTRTELMTIMIAILNALGISWVLIFIGL